jgi:hypothetical protein
MVLVWFPGSSGTFFYICVSNSDNQQIMKGVQIVHKSLDSLSNSKV